MRWLQYLFAPCIQVFYRDWPRRKLEIVRGSFVDGLTLNVSKGSDGKYDVCIATRQIIMSQKTENGHTSALRGPAWNAHLPDIDKEVVSTFEVNRCRFNGYLLLVQTPKWEFLCGVGNVTGQVEVGSVIPAIDPRPT